MIITECTRQNLCVDCDDETCWHHGKLISDCPKYICDRPKSRKEECETCEFLKKYQEEMRKVYRKENKSEN